MGRRVVKHYSGVGKKGRRGVMCNFDAKYSADGETVGHALSLQRYGVGDVGMMDSNVPASWLLL